MARRLFISNFKRYAPIRAICWAILSIAIVEVLLNLLGPRSEMEGEFQQIRTRVEREKAPTVQVLGDSVAAGGILGTLLGNNERVSVRNDSVPGSGPVFSYFLLKAEIEAGKVPRILIIAHSPHTFNGVRFPVLIGRFARGKELPEIAWNSRDLSDVTYGLLTRFSYLLSYREEFKNSLKGDLRFFVQKSRPKKSELERIDNYYASMEKKNFRPRDLGTQIWPMYKEPFAVSALNEIYFSKLLTLAKDHGIATYWVTMPITQRVNEYRKKIQYQDDFLEFLDQYIEQGRLKYLQREFWVYEDSYFDDLSHLNVPGAIMFTEHLNKITNFVSRH